MWYVKDNERRPSKQNFWEHFWHCASFLPPSMAGGSIYDLHQSQLIVEAKVQLDLMCMQLSSYIVIGQKWCKWCVDTTRFTLSRCMRYHRGADACTPWVSVFTVLLCSSLTFSHFILNKWHCLTVYAAIKSCHRIVIICYPPHIQFLLKYFLCHQRSLPLYGLLWRQVIKLLLPGLELAYAYLCYCLC